MNTPQNIVVHCSANADHGLLNWDEVRRYHLRLGWRDIGYHYGVDLVDGGYEVLKGRPEYQKGSHCPQRDMNRLSLGVCLIGGDPMTGFGPDYPMPPAQWARAVALCAELCWAWSIPFDNIFLHRDFNPGKSCPGVGFDRAAFRAAVEAFQI